jgi:hypothetical protein
MKPQTVISLVAAAVLALTSVTAAAQGQHGQRSDAQAHDRAKVERGQRDFDHDRMRDRDRAMDPAQDRDRDQDRKQDRIHQTEDGNGIYGGEFMSEQERSQFREQLRLTESDPQARTEFLAQHREKMQKRAKDQGKHLDDLPDDGS